jgi:hypothetical protein
VHVRVAVADLLAIERCRKQSCVVKDNSPAKVLGSQDCNSACRCSWEPPAGAINNRRTRSCTQRMEENVANRGVVAEGSSVDCVVVGTIATRSRSMKVARSTDCY